MADQPLPQPRPTGQVEQIRPAVRTPAMSGSPDCCAEKLFHHFAAGLRNFAFGILRSNSLADDAVQSTFVKFLEKGNTVENPAAVKAWLYRVTYNESLQIRRRQSISEKHLEKFGWLSDQMNQARSKDADSILAGEETSQQVKLALESLTDVQRVVVQKRIYEGLKFREIAEQLNVPLGTVLARMQSSLKKLKQILT